VEGRFDEPRRPGQKVARAFSSSIITLLRDMLVTCTVELRMLRGRVLLLVGMKCGGRWTCDRKARGGVLIVDPQHAQLLKLVAFPEPVIYNY
jgi:hypothetical protein